MNNGQCKQCALRHIDHITIADVRTILMQYSQVKEDIIENYCVHNASDKMLGFLADYWKLQVRVYLPNRERKTLCFFIKAISKTNVAKANMVRELKLFQKELMFYSVIMKNLQHPDIKPWSAKFVTNLHEAMVLEDLNAKQYKTRDKLQPFDEIHTLRALEALSRFHASSIIYEEKKRKELKTHYNLGDEFGYVLDKGGYDISDTWFFQCKNGALETLKTHSKYRNNFHTIQKIEARWDNIWESALVLSDFSTTHRNVICHRDLWNNNILFHYKINDQNEMVPDDCVMVDYQAVRCQPPAGDVMLLLYCNLDPKYREDNFYMLLNYYYRELGAILRNCGIRIEDTIPYNKFLESAEEQRLWGLVLSACLVPQFWLNDDIITNVFSDTTQFEEILTRNKAAFIKEMINKDEGYKTKVINIFEEIVEKYCLNL